MKLAVTFTNLGPYHRARLRALARELDARNGSLTVYETAGAETKYPWLSPPDDEPFRWSTLFPDAALESLTAGACRAAIRDALDRDRPDMVAIVGYVRPECVEALSWAGRNRRQTILMSESQAIDRPRVWWKEAIKRQRVRRCASALVGGTRHMDYLVQLGMPAERIALGYNAVDNDYFASKAEDARTSMTRPNGAPSSTYFLTVSRFAPEKNLPRLLRAYASYRMRQRGAAPWSLVLCGDGPDRQLIQDEIQRLGLTPHVCLPGFSQAGELPMWYAHAGAFVLPSRSEPWGLVANEAAACGLPLLISDRCGCVETLVPDPPGTTGWRFDPGDERAITEALLRIAGTTESRRIEIGGRAARIVANWGPERFAQGALEAIDMAGPRRPAVVRAQPAYTRAQHS